MRVRWKGSSCAMLATAKPSCLLSTRCDIASDTVRRYRVKFLQVVRYLHLILYLAPVGPASLLVCLELSSSSSVNIYQPWHLLPSPQDLLFSAGPVAPSSCIANLASADHCARLQIIFTYLLVYYDLAFKSMSNWTELGGSSSISSLGGQGVDRVSEVGRGQ